MTKDAILKQCILLRASLKMLEAQVDALEAAIGVDVPTARVEVPQSCQGYKAEDCARQSDEGCIDLSVFGSERTLMCRGCGETLPALG